MGDACAGPGLTRPVPEQSGEPNTRKDPAGLGDPSPTGPFPFGGGKGTRTPNPLLAKQVRYQLRHAPVSEYFRYFILQNQLILTS